MPIKAVQQFMLGTVLNNEQQAKETLAAMKAAGYDGIELCGFMIHPIGFVVKLLTKAAGMPVGKGGNKATPRTGYSFRCRALCFAGNLFCLTGCRCPAARSDFCHPGG